ncbi:MAG: hypothetical protein IJ608_11965 [Lachnospiraceae bacterium]|nr:hypothetical protein [Lachnospiraceae bacterium]
MGITKKYTSILMAGFTFSDIRGVISPRKLLIGFDDIDELRARLDKLKTNIISEFELENMDEQRWIITYGCKAVTE